LEFVTRLRFVLFPAIRYGNETIELPECGDCIVTLAYQFIIHVIRNVKN